MKITATLAKTEFLMRLSLQLTRLTAKSVGRIAGRKKSPARQTHQPISNPHWRKTLGLHQRLESCHRGCRACGHPPKYRTENCGLSQRNPTKSKGQVRKPAP